MKRVNSKIRAPTRPLVVDLSNIMTKNCSCYLLAMADTESDFQLPDIVLSGCLRLGLSWFNWWVSFAPEFLCCYFCESSCLFYLSFNFDFYVSKIMHL